MVGFLKRGDESTDSLKTGNLLKGNPCLCVFCSSLGYDIYFRLCGKCLITCKLTHKLLLLLVAYLFWIQSDFVVEWLTHLLHIREVPASNIGLQTGYPK